MLKRAHTRSSRMHGEVVAAFVALCLAPVAALGQAPEPQFEVASIKQNLNATGGLTGGFCHGTTSTLVGTGLPGVPVDPGANQVTISPGTCQFGKTTLREIIAAAYAIPRKDFERLLVGGPKWVDTDLFDIEAKAGRQHTQAELERMLQALLADRFGLRLHRDRRQLDGYSLVAAKEGSKMKLADAGSPGRVRTVGVGSLTAVATPVERLAQMLTIVFGKSVVDETGLSGSYDFTLKWTPASSESSPFGPIPPELRQRLDAPLDPLGPSIFTAVQEQLGLSLQPRKVPTELIVIDAAHHPTAN